MYWHLPYDEMHTGGALHWLTQRGAVPGTICVLQHRHYPFFGSRRQHRVLQPAYVPSSEWLLALFRKENVTVVAAAPRLGMSATRRFLGFEECLARHRKMFRKVSETPDFVIFQVE